MGNAPTTGDDETDDEWTPTSTSNAGWRTRARGWVTRACLVVASAVFALYVVGLVVPDEEEDGAREGDGGGGGGGGGGAGRVHRVPEVIDLRAVRPATKVRAGVAYYADAELPSSFWANVYAARTGAPRCGSAPSADVCTSCSPSSAVATLCECALAVQAGMRRRGRWYRLAGSVPSGPLLKNTYNSEAARQCCLRSVNASQQAHGGNHHGRSRRGRARKKQGRG